MSTINGVTTRGTSSKDVQGSSYDVRARKHYLLVTYQSDEGEGTTRCYRCGDLLDWYTMTTDRIKPGCQGGRYVRANIRPACGGCNSRTGAALASDKTIKKVSRRPKPPPPIEILDDYGWPWGSEETG